MNLLPVDPPSCDLGQLSTTFSTEELTESLDPPGMGSLALSAIWPHNSLETLFLQWARLQSTQLLARILGHQVRDFHFPVSPLRQHWYLVVQCYVRLGMDSWPCLVTACRLLLHVCLEKSQEKTNHSQTPKDLVLHTCKEPMYWVDAFRKMTDFFFFKHSTQTLCQTGISCCFIWLPW